MSRALRKVRTLTVGKKEMRWVEESQEDANADVETEDVAEHQ